jgi:predicted short-subunit dehydrogenase-like oxidoreductase (DUF2520 family)
VSGTHRLPRSRVAVVGPGRVGTTLATALVRAGHRVVAVAGGRPDSRARFTGLIAGARDEADPAEAARRADLVLVTTPDDAIADVVTAIALADGFRDGQRVVHTSGAHGLEVLRRARLAGAFVAACHPAQTVPSGPPDADRLLGAAWAVTAAGDDLGWALDLVEQLGGHPHQVPDEVRPLYHAGLTVASNAVGAAVAVARQLLLGARVDDPAAFLDPLVGASVANVTAHGAEALTGPIVRGDVGTVAAHLARLDADVPELAAAYRQLGRVVLGQVRLRLDDDTRDTLQDLLAD